MKKLISTLLVLGCFCSAVCAQQGTLTTLTMAWNGRQRMYSLYLPPVLPLHPAMVVCLHSTATAPQNNPPLFRCRDMGWEYQADLSGFLLVVPISSWKPNVVTGSGWFFWESYNTSTFFPNPPDDSGFLCCLIQELVAQYKVNPGRVFVTGSSSGGMMTHRVGIDSSDLVAAIAPCRQSYGWAPQLRFFLTL